MINHNKQKIISLRISKKTSQKLKKYCQKKEISQSHVIRKWINEKLKNIS